MTLDDLLRPDCPRYNEAIRELWERDSKLRKNHVKAVEAAASLYDKYSGESLSEPWSGPIRPEVLLAHASNFEVLPWIKANEEGQQNGRWGLTAIVNLVTLSDEEKAVLRKSFEAFDYNEDEEYCQASFVVMSVSLSIERSDLYRNRMLPVCRDGAEARVISELSRLGHKAKHTRPAHLRWLDRLRAAL